MKTIIRFGWVLRKIVVPLAVVLTASRLVASQTLGKKLGQLFRSS